MKRLLSLIAAPALLLAVSAGCSSTDGPATEDDDASSGDVTAPDAGSPDADTSEEEEERLVAAVEISLDPARHVYRPDSSVKATATVIDSDGNVVDNPDSIAWSNLPVDNADASADGSFTLQKEGPLTLKACATFGEQQEICGEKTIVVDGNRPTIEITSPTPGAMLGNSQSKTIEVEGKVTDTHGEVSAVMNGRRLELADDGSFSTEIDAKFGVNTIHIVANDGLQRRDSKETLAVLWAPNYETLGSDLKFSFDQGVGIDLGQNFFDDGVAPMRMGMESKLITKDLNDILRLLISNIELSKQLPDPLVDSGSTTLRIKSVSIAEPDISMDVTDEGLAAYLHLNPVQMETAGQAVIEGETLDLTGTVGARISATTAISVTKPGNDKSFEANVDNVQLSLDELTPSFRDKKASAIFKLAEGALRSKLEEMLIGTVREEIVATLPDMLSETLNSLEGSLSDQTFEFSSELTGTRKIHFRGDISTFETVYRDSMFALVSNEVETPGTDVHPKSRGIPMTTDADGGMPLYDAGRIQIALRLGLLNGILTGIWKSGYLDLDLTEALPEDIGGIIERAELAGKMPPVIRPANGTEPYDLVLEAGQLEIETEALGQIDRYGVNIRAGINVSLEDNQLTLTVPDEPLLDSWLISTDGDSPQIGAEDLNKLILTKVWPRIQKSLKGGLNITLPVPNLSNLNQIAPTLDTLELDFVMERPMAVRGGFIVFDSTLQGTLPLGD